MVKIENLSKQYQSDKYALKDINAYFENGLYGILGKNGSGKTTLFRLITKILEPSKGSVKIFSKNELVKKESEIKSIIGYLPQEFGFYSNYTVEEVMEFICILREIPKNKRKKIKNELLEWVNLSDFKSKKYASLSGGMKRRLGLAQSMIGSPEILIVDEPTAGVDPEERIKIRQMLSQYAEDHTVLFSTHIIEDIEYTCNNVLILEKGNLKYQGDISELVLNASYRLEEKVFDTLKEFQEFSNAFPVLTFKRKTNETIVAVIEKKYSANAFTNASLEDAYMLLTQGENNEF